MPPLPSPQLLFDSAALARARARAKACPNALLEETTAEIIDRLSFIKKPFLTVLDWQNRSPTLGAALAAQDPARHVQQGSPAPEGTYDLILSNLVLHAVNDVPDTLKQAYAMLKPGGLFLAALAGGDSLCELRHALYEAEMAVRGGMAPRIFPFMKLADGAALLQRAGFAMPVADAVRYTFTYDHMFALMHDLRRMGEGNALAARERRPPPRTLFLEAAAMYARLFADAEGRVPATFDILFLAGWQE